MNKKVEIEKDILLIESLAKIIWNDTYKNILSKEEIEYMLKKYLSLDSISESIKDGYEFELIYEEDSLIGFTSYKIRKDDCFLSKLYILPKFQGKGYATKQIKELIKFGKKITLTVNKNNLNAYNKYLHLGFKVIESIKTDIGSGFIMDDYVMQRN